VGTRAITAIGLDQDDRPSDEAPPYPTAEYVFTEDDQDGCGLTADAVDEARDHRPAAQTRARDHGVEPATQGMRPTHDRRRTDRRRIRAPHCSRSGCSRRNAAAK
jgi:hypothetical protein